MTVGKWKPVAAKDIPGHFKWRLEDIYESEGDFEEDFKKISDMLNKLNAYAGRLNESPEIFVECLKLRDTIYRILDKLYIYCHLKRDEDNNNTKFQELTGRVESLNACVDRNTSFITPEILTIPDKILEKFYDAQEELRVYRHYIDDIKRTNEHVLTCDMESILSAVEDVISAPENIYKMLCNVDIVFPQVKNENGEAVELSEGCYHQLIRSHDRETRKNAFTALYITYSKYRNTFAALLNGTVKKDVFYSKIKKYNSSIEASLFEDNIPYSVYETIVDTVTHNLSPLHEYIELKKEILGIESMHMYDLYVPVTDSRHIFIPYEECMNMIERSLEPLGKGYQNLLSRGFNSRWIDVFGHAGKSSGAYSWGAYDTHPYILLNYNGTLESVSTVAHEMGHSIHSYLAGKAQPYIYSHYSSLTAEVASAVNEVILLNYLLKTTKNNTKRMLVINQLLENISTIIYRQTMFTEFENVIHQKSENGETLTSNYLCSLWRKLNIKYYGPNISVDDEMSIEWARIAHFHWDFYVYKYVAGYAGAICLSDKIINEGTPAVEKYMTLLKSGDSDYSINLLQNAGVDMTSSEPMIRTIDLFKKLMDELKNL